MHGLNVLSTIVDEITRANETVDGQTHGWMENICLCPTMPANATKIYSEEPEHIVYCAFNIFQSLSLLGVNFSSRFTQKK